MFKTKLIAAAIALGMSAFAHADIDGSAANGEFVFSAFDINSGVGYTFDMANAGFNGVFGADVRMNSLIGPANTSTSIGTSLVSNPVNGVVFDYLLPSFSTFAAQANVSAIKWNVLAVDVSGARRLIQTVGTDPVAMPYTNLTVKNAADAAYGYFGAVNGKMSSMTGVDVDDAAITVTADGAAYAGTQAGNFQNKGYTNAGSLDATLNLYVAGATSTLTSANGQAAIGGFLLGQDGRNVQASVYQAADGYHLQIALAPVPEPETYAMLLAGLGLLGFAARRKNA